MSKKTIILSSVSTENFRIFNRKTQFIIRFFESVLKEMLFDNSKYTDILITKLKGRDILLSFCWKCCEIELTSSQEV